ncbi:MAG: transcriptional repressor NrdR [Myxococcota bacterium]|jgi:transcriptional repressor NrdR
MRCPFCGKVDNRVVDSRVARDGGAIRRRRHCEACAERFTTYESVETVLADVQKRDGQTQPFDADKLLRSIRLASKKRPITLTTLTDFVEQLERDVSSRPRKTVTSMEIGDQVMAFLRDLDPVTYVRYASVYRSFGSIGEFLAELAVLEPPAAKASVEGRAYRLPRAAEPAPPVQTELLAGPDDA